jgi:methyl-accepting chemotaxis protein
MDQVVQSNAAQTEELSSTAQSLTNQAQQLQALVGKFKLDHHGSASTAPVTAAFVAAGKRPAPGLGSRFDVKKMPRPKLVAMHNDYSGTAAGVSIAAQKTETGFEEF